MWHGVAVGGLTVALIFAFWIGSTRIRRVTDALWAPTPTPTPSWVGKTQAAATPILTWQSRIAEFDTRTGRPVTAAVALRQAPGRGADPNGFAVQPGERVFLIGVESIGGERFFQVRSFDGLRRGWLPESALPADERPSS